MKPIFKSALGAFAAALLLSACDSPSALVLVNETNIDQNPLKVITLSDAEEKSWSGKDLVNDTIPGMSVERTYDELLAGKTGQQVIVAVIDSGIDITHEDLKNVIWTNPTEIAGNGIDDDKNGYVDDIHGWNFLGEITDEQLEMARIIDRYDAQFKGKTITQVSKADKEMFEAYLRAKTEVEKKRNEALANKTRYEQLKSGVSQAHEVLAAKLGKQDYTKEDVAKLDKTDPKLQQAIAVVSQMFQYEDTMPEMIKSLDEGLDYFTGQLNANYALNKNFRSVLGDDPYDIKDTSYGNNNVYGPEPEGARHGTHVAGIIAAQRDNGKGMNGVAENVSIMAVRAVPDGDEYDKDIALAIRYAVDNGAKVINTSFGKYYAQNPEWVYDAIKYAAKKDVLIVNAAGNEGLSLDDPKNRVYPNDQIATGEEFANNVLTVGALNKTYGGSLVADFSNYGKSAVDVFAPGVRIYATVPEGKYDWLQGTSMAAPNVAGVAAMLRSYYPRLKASQIKELIMRSGTSLSTVVVIAGDDTNTGAFNTLSKSGKMVNMYNAFRSAELSK